MRWAYGKSKAGKRWLGDNAEVRHRPQRTWTTRWPISTGAQHCNRDWRCIWQSLSGQFLLARLEYVGGRRGSRPSLYSAALGRAAARRQELGAVGGRMRAIDGGSRS